MQEMMRFLFFFLLLLLLFGIGKDEIWVLVSFQIKDVDESVS